MKNKLLNMTFKRLNKHHLFNKDQLQQTTIWFYSWFDNNIFFYYSPTLLWGQNVGGESTRSSRTEGQTQRQGGHGNDDIHHRNTHTHTHTLHGSEALSAGL